MSREHCLHLFPLQTRNLTSHLVQDKLSSASTSKNDFYFLIVKAQEMPPKMFIFLPLQNAEWYIFHKENPEKLTVVYIQEYLESVQGSAGEDKLGPF